MIKYFEFMGMLGTKVASSLNLTLIALRCGFREGFETLVVHTVKDGYLICKLT